jgi:hypothetical protein
MSQRAITLSGVALTIMLAGCGKDESAENKPVRTQREKDSILANSSIPYAGAVKKAMKVADSATARQGRMVDTTPESP